MKIFNKQFFPPSTKLFFYVILQIIIIIEDCMHKYKKNHQFEVILSSSLSLKTSKKKVSRDYCEYTTISIAIRFRWIANEEKLCLSIQLYTGDVAQYCVNFECNCVKEIWYCFLNETQHFFLSHSLTLSSLF